jgi:hypothetical protein
MKTVYCVEDSYLDLVLIEIMLKKKKIKPIFLYRYKDLGYLLEVCKPDGVILDWLAVGLQEKERDKLLLKCLKLKIPTCVYYDFPINDLPESIPLIKKTNKPNKPFNNWLAKL